MRKFKKVLALVVFIMLTTVNMASTGCVSGLGDSYLTFHGLELHYCYETYTVCDASGGGYDVEVSTHCNGIWSDNWFVL